MYVISSLLYYIHDVGAWPDERYDNACKTLASSFPKLPLWFTERVSIEDLRAGTGYALVPTPEETEICEAFISGQYDLRISF